MSRSTASRAAVRAPKPAPPAPHDSPVPLALICLVALLAPSLAALPGDSTWSPVLTAMLALAGAWQLFTRRERSASHPLRLPDLLSVSVVALGSLSLLAQWLIVSHGQPHYLDAMLKALSVWVALWTLLATGASLGKDRTRLYAFAVALVAGAAIAAGQGLSDYLLHVKHGEITARESGTSTPDFFAGFLVMSTPITLALFLGAPGGQGRILWMLYGVAFVIEAAVLPATGSRFGLIAFVVSLAVFAAGLVVARRHGLRIEAATRTRMIALAVLVVVFAGLAARPILHRLQGAQVSAQANSADFRVWTWKGAAKYALANPILGTGPGTFVYGYQKYAYVGFTRHAHNAYLQVADELGIPALLVLLALFGSTLVIGFRRLSLQETIDHEDNASAEFLQQAAPYDDRFLMCGLIAGVVAGSIQNLVDSDLYVTFNGVMLWALIGLILALSRPIPTRAKIPAWAMPLGGIVCLAVTMLGICDGLAGFAAQSGDYAAAASLDPLDPQNQRFLGTKVYPAQGDMAATERALLASEDLAPDSASYTRIGKFDEETGRMADAVAAYETGLRYEPQSITLLLALAQLQEQLGHHQEALAAYRMLAAQESSPYGQVPALGDILEIRYVFADKALGDDALARGDSLEAMKRYLHAEQIIANYLAAGGASNGMRQVMTGGKPDLEQDARLRAVYTSVTDALERIYARDGKIQESASVKRDVENHIGQFSGTITGAKR